MKKCSKSDPERESKKKMSTKFDLNDYSEI